MNKKRIILLLATTIILVVNGCQMNKKSKLENKTKLEKEILKVEQDFVEMVKEDNVKEAFLHFAHDDAVLFRNNSLIKGKDSIKVYFENQTLKDVKLQWTPDFVEVASSGDLAYTYGQYVFSAIDINGKHINTKGVFHTIWRKQGDGTWKFVWD